MHAAITAYNWDAWSGHALMLGMLEQTSLYNAANFSLGNNAANSYGYYANSTVTNTRVSVFLIVPLDASRRGNARRSLQLGGRGAWIPLDLSYVASVGTTTLSPNNTVPTNPWATQGSTGLFWWYTR